MYANLIVTLVTGETLSAWDLTFSDENDAIVHLDDQDGTGSYAEPAGTRKVSLPMIESVRADF